MNRKTQRILMVLLLVIFCLGVFVSCRNEKADYFNYSEENLGVMGKLVRLMHGWIGNYGWTVVVFTVFLKVAMLPIDIWQRVSSRKTTLKNKKMQPLIAEIDRRYGANSQRANEEKQKLYKKEGFSAFSSCLPMIVSMVIFFVMFAGLRQYSTYSSVTTFRGLSDTYFDNYYAAVKEIEGENSAEYAFISAEYESAFAASEETNEYKKKVASQIVGINHFEDAEQFKDAKFVEYRNVALGKVVEYYEGHHESWLWLQNVWQPDTWTEIMPAYGNSTNSFTTSVDMSAFGSDEGKAHYEMIRSAVLSSGTRGENGKWNGLMILPILSIGLSFLSMFITQLMDKKGRAGEAPAENKQEPQQAASNKAMMFMMPLMMAYFGFIYTGAFAIYMVCNYMLSIISTVLLRAPVEKIVENGLNKEEEKQNSKKASYMR